MDAPPLDYAARDRRRSRRAWWLAALAASAVAVGVVGRLLYARVAPSLAARFALIAAQQDVDTLPSAGEAVDFTPPAGGTDAAPSPLARAATRYMAALQTTQAFDADAFLGRIVNEDGGARYVCVRLARQRPFTAGTAAVDAASLILTVAEPATPLATGRGIRSIRVVGLPAFRDRLHLDAPRVDPADARRLLVDGASDGTPFAFFLTLDANDRARFDEAKP